MIIVVNLATVVARQKKKKLSDITEDAGTVAMPEALL